MTLPSGEVFAGATPHRLDAMSEQFEIVEVAVDDVRAGDVLAVTDDPDPRANAFHVADVKSVHPTATGQMTHVTLTSTAAGRDGEPMVLDVIEICGAYSEYKDLAEFHNDHDKEDYPDIEAIEGRTTVVNIGGGGFIIEAF